MLEQVACMFDNMDDMLECMKKNLYENRMKDFRETYGHYFSEMTAFTAAAEDKEAAADTLADTFIEAVFTRFEVKGKIKGFKQADINLFMVYFVFPALLLTEHPDAKLIADVLCSKWSKRFKKSKISYTTYDTIVSTFRKSFMGISWGNKK